MTQSTINFYQGTAGRSEQFLYNNEAAIVDAGDLHDYVQFTAMVAYAQTIYGGLGFDIISSGFGADTIFGDRPSDGDGDASTNLDWIIAGAGNDVVFGQSGRDYVNGDIGNDYIAGGAGGDLLQGGFGDDTVLGGDNDDILIGGAVDPLLYGRSASVLVSFDGISGDPITPTTINGLPGLLTSTSTGDDNLSGGDGNDILSGQDGNDTLRGDADDDVIEGGEGADDIDGGSGGDTASYAGSATGVTVNLAFGIGQSGDAAGDTLNGIETLVGSAFTDNLFGDAGVNTLNGGAGTDFLTGGLGLDFLFGGSEADTFDYNARQETLRGSANRDRIVDFSQAQDDVIDLSDIDANTHKGGNQAFHFIRGQKFHHQEGGLRFKNDILSGDVNGDGRPDFQIDVANVNLVKGDFIL
jgi:Ca2+-binding RTX toxin-like protein